VGTAGKAVTVVAVDDKRVVHRTGPVGLGALYINQDGTRLITGTYYPQKIQIWDVRSGTLLYETASETHQKI
jgi:hypothetical protein